MGTEVHYSMYLSEYYSMRDLNENPRSSNWPLHQDKKIPQNGGIVSMGGALNGYHGFDKEKLRETMLKQEYIFRHQVFELHRLYRRQRDLVNNLKNNPSAVFSAIQLNTKSPFNHAKGKIMQSSFEKSKVKLIADSRESKKVCRRLFGLELPSADYMNHDIEQKGSFNLSVEENSHSNANKVSNYENSCLGVGNNSSHNDRALFYDLHLKRNHGFPNLNEPVDHVEEEYIPACSNTLINNASSKQKILLQVSCENAHSGIYYLHNKLYESSHVGSSKQILYQHSENDRNHKCMLTTAQTGETINSRYSLVGSRTAQGSSILEPSLVETNIITTSMPLAQEQGERKKRKIFGVEISESIDNASLASCVLDQKMCRNYVPPADKTKSSNISVPLNSASLTLKPIPGVIKEGLTVNGFSQSVLSLKDEEPAQHDTLHGPESDSNESQTCKAPISSKHVKCINEITASEDFVEHDICKNQTDCGCGVDALTFKDLNASSELGINNQDKVIGLQKFAFQDRQDRTHDALQWIKTMPHCNGLPLDKGQRPYHLNLESLNDRFQKLYHKDARIRNDSVRNLNDFASAALSYDAGNKVKINDCSSERKIIGSRVSRECHSLNALTSLKSTLKPHFLASIDNGNSITDDSRMSKRTDNGIDPKCEGHSLMHSSSGQRLFDTKVTRPMIDLNLSFDVDTQSLVDSPTVKLGDGKDLVDYVEKESEPVHSLEHTFSLAYEALIKSAAEALVNISSSLFNNHRDMSDAHETEASIDSLSWFAEVATSYEGDIQIATLDTSLGKNKCNYIDCKPDELDKFEFMTLNLRETEMEELCYKPAVSLCENANDEPTLSKKTRKGQTRRGRQQKKDFQRDILPRLASLSRNEVRDDIQTIEEVVKSSGGCWQSCLTWKIKNAKGRGKKRSVATTPSTTATCQSQGTQPISEELVLEKSSLTGWGKKTRRQQRYLIQNHSISTK